MACVFSTILILLETHPAHHVDFVAMHVETVISSALVHELQSDERGSMLIKDESVLQERP